MRRLLWGLILIIPLFSLADQIHMSSALNIPTPTFQVRNYRFNGFYVGFNVGVSNPGGKTMDNDFDTGYDLTPQVGYQIGQGRVEFAPVFTSNQPARGGVTALDTYAMMFNGYYDFRYAEVPILPRLTPYLGIGFGFMNESGGDGSVNGPNETQWAYQFILGAMYRITLNWYVQGDYHLLAWPEGGGHFNLFNIGFTYHFL